MAILKKGSKGKDVNELQQLLNKNGAKPPLTVDGDFGPKTEAAVKAFQKKMKLAVDGKVGDNTMAALKHRKPLPEMTVEDYTNKRSEFQKDWLKTQDGIKMLTAVKNEISDLQVVWDKEVDVIDKAFVENYGHWKRIAKSSDDLIKRQKAFAEARTKNPSKAEKLLKECQALDAEVRAIQVSLISPNRAKMNDAARKLQKKLNSSTKKIQDVMDSLRAKSV